jgi:hypothetical protein
MAGAAAGFTERVSVATDGGGDRDKPRTVEDFPGSWRSWGAGFGCCGIHREGGVR